MNHKNLVICHFSSIISRNPLQWGYSILVTTKSISKMVSNAILCVNQNIFDNRIIVPQ